MSKIVNIQYWLCVWSLLYTAPRIMKFLFPLAICLCLVTLGAQTTWYISPNGLDTNSGTSSTAAFATINRAIDLAACGDSIHVLPGIYHERVNATRICPSDNRLVIQGDQTSRPKIIGDAMATNKYAISALGTGFVFRHFLLESPFPEICSQSHQVIVGNGDHFTFDDIHLRKSGYDGIKTYGTCDDNDFAFNWKILNSLIEDCGLACPASIQNGDGIDFTGCQSCLVENSIIRNNRGHQMQIKLDAVDVTVRNCHLEGQYIFQIGLPGAVAQCNSNGPNAIDVLLERNTILAKGDTSEFIFKLADVQNLRIENNTVVKDSIGAIDLGFICFGGCTGSAAWENTPRAPLIIKNNIFYSRANVPFVFGVDTTFFDPFGIYDAVVNADYNLFFNHFNDFVNPVDGGSNSLVGDPVFCDYPATFSLQEHSPCIDTGDPTTINDIDGTRADIGAKPFLADCLLSSWNEPLSKAQLIVYPNPVRDVLYLKFAERRYFLDLVRIINSQGQQVYATHGRHRTDISVQTLPAGFYLLQVVDVEGRLLATKRFVKE